MSELQILVTVAVLLVALTLGVAIVLAVRLVRARGTLRRAGLPQSKKWLFWAALGYLVLPVDLLPDPVYIDDIGVLLMALRSLHADRPEREKLP
ncbi:YkvA family protein [Streptomyces sp. NPDC059092]|uniref:YkvA family protein n=1 Tax=Streptomyces sp. NPDC059092 TaxID=3346725 RepID=UPI0036C90943